MRWKNLVGFIGVLGIVGSGIFPAAAETGETYELKNKFTAGEKIYLNLVVKDQGVSTEQTKTGPVDTAIDHTMEAVVSFQITNVEPAGWAEMQIGYESLMISGVMLSGGTQNLVDKFGLRDQPVLIKMNSRGEVDEMKSGGGPGSRLKEVMRSTTRQMPFLKCPAEPVPLGCTWREQQQIPYSAAARPMIANITYTLEKIEEEGGEKVAVIQSELQIDEQDVPVDSSRLGGNLDNIIVQFTFKEFKIQGGGQIRFSLDRGRILSVESKQEVLEHLTGSMDISQTSFDQDVIQKTSRTIHAVFTDQIPDSLKPDTEAKTSETTADPGKNDESGE
ncbi:MAG TPA: hypothetical protein PKV38_17490 [bacterium]|nr:hypothetical protein [bacterium]